MHWTRRGFSRPPRASTSRATSAALLAGLCRYRISIAGGTAPSSSRPTKGSTTSRAAMPRSAACRHRRCGTAISRTGSTPAVSGITIYDPATTRVVNGVTVRDPFPNNRIPVDRFSQTAKDYIALARSVLVPNRGATPGTFDYVNNNYVSEGRSTIETTNRYSLKVDHTLSNTEPGGVRVQSYENRSEGRPGWRLRVACTVQRFSQKTRSTAISIAPAGIGSARAWSTI